MNKSINFLGICIISASIIISATLIFISNNNYKYGNDRYSYEVNDKHIITFDKQTGNYYYYLTDYNKGKIYYVRNDIKQRESHSAYK